MRVRFHNRFFDELNAIKEFIAKDSTSRANGFVDEVFSKCLDLKDMPAAHNLNYLAYYIIFNTKIQY